MDTWHKIGSMSPKVDMSEILFIVTLYLNWTSEIHCTIGNIVDTRWVQMPIPTLMGNHSKAILGILGINRGNIINL